MKLLKELSNKLKKADKGKLITRLSFAIVVLVGLIILYVKVI